MESVVQMQFIDAADTVYSQAFVVPAGMNQLRIEGQYVSASGTVSSGVKITPQYSPDLQRWYDDTSNLTLSTSPPSEGAANCSGGTSLPMGAMQYARLKLVNADSIRALVSASASFYSTDT